MPHTVRNGAALGSLREHKPACRGSSANFSAAIWRCSKQAGKRQITPYPVLRPPAQTAKQKARRNMPCLDPEGIHGTRNSGPSTDLFVLRLRLWSHHAGPTLMSCSQNWVSKRNRQISWINIRQRPHCEATCLKLRPRLQSLREPQS